MRKSASLGAIAASLIAVSISPVFSHEASEQTTPWVVHKTVDGRLTPESKGAAVKMRQKAASQGHITLWLLPRSADGWDPSRLTDEQHALSCAEILQPLVRQGHVWHPGDEPINYGSICLVRASAAGVALLLRHASLEQIMGAH